MRFNEARKIQKFTDDVKSDVPNLIKIMSIEAQNFFIRNFIKQGFDDNGVTPWKQRKRTKNGTGRAILVKRGALRRSIRISRPSSYYAYIVSNLPYAVIHNEGGTIQKGFDRKILSFNRDGKFQKTRTRKQRAGITHQQQVTINEHDIRMPKRQYIGDSSRMNKIIGRKLAKRIDLIFNRK